MKRIISTILVVCMLALALVGCGYSLADDKMTNYATFSSDKFEELLKKILIEDGDFTTDPATREAKVLENIYSAIASAVKTDAEKEKEGTPGERDVVYYSYYATAVFEEVTAYFYADKMKSGSPASIQLRPGNDFGKDELSAKIAALVATHDFSNFAYSSVSSGKVEEGDVAFVTFTKTVGTETPVVYTNHKITIGKAPEGDAKATTLESYLSGKSIASSIDKLEIKDAEGKVTETYSSIKINWVSSRETAGTVKEGDKVYVSYTKKVGTDKATTVTNEAVIAGPATPEGETALTIAEYVTGKEIAKTLDKLTVTEGDVTTEYTNIKVNWRANNADPIGTVVDTPFDEKTEVTDSTGTKRDLKDVELTYYVYPVYYTEIPEYTAEVLIDKILGEDLTEDSIYEILFVKEITELGEDATEEERDAVKENATKYKTEDNLSIKDLVKKIVAYYDDIKTAQTALDNAEDALDKAETAYNEAKADLDEAKAAETPDEAKIAELEAAFKKADEALNGKADEAEDKKTGAKANADKAQKAYDKIGTDKTDNIKKLLGIKGEGQTDTLETVLYKNYKIVTYDYLQLLYHEEIKNKLATEVYFFLTENITVGDKLPEKAVKEAYTQLFETIESDFYTGTYDTSKKISNYKQYNGNFDKFLIDEVNELCAEDDGFVKVETVKAAKAALDKKARESVELLVEVYLAAQTYDQVITDKEYDEYKDELEEYYYYYVLYYKNFSIEEMLGKTNMMTAAQFNKLMDWLLETEEVKADADENGYVKITHTYKNDLFGDYEFCEEGQKPASEAKDAE